MGGTPTGCVTHSLMEAWGWDDPDRSEASMLRWRPLQEEGRKATVQPCETPGLGPKTRPLVLFDKERVVAGLLPAHLLAHGLGTVGGAPGKVWG